eukprot:TRINITY_DN747_c0_g1_i3.p1 TRINITY_DN747_c0_g1~~TRINITY_DN747_c0_g1_i3.p1  ORF type:complete len:86 (-),score=9.61 TRINITY_DN747_c0_g1_i3:46-303(-)
MTGAISNFQDICKQIEDNRLIDFHRIVIENEEPLNVDAFAMAKGNWVYYERLTCEVFYLRYTNEQVDSMIRSKNVSHQMYKPYKR